MPRRTNLNHVLVIGSGPIVIGQACEFDYSGTQACRVLEQEGLRVTLINSNPATIMTDPEFADHTYIEPIDSEYIEKIFEKEAAEGHPIDAVLATLGGQTALNAAIQLDRRGILAKHHVELIGADIEAIERGEDRQKFKDIVEKIGGESARSRVCHNMEEVHETVAELGLPVVVRPSFTMGGLGSGLAYTYDDIDRIAGGGLAASPEANVLIEESILGWKEYELELMRDGNDNVVIVCSIENVDAVGVHTGDSVTVAPALTLTDREFQVMRDQAIAILREVGVDTGGCNIQFAVNPNNGRIVTIEMNPRVSRSSALASKATGFPIAKIAAKLAIGYTLDEIRNDITGVTPAAFEPTLDYVVVKAPRFAFEKFPGSDDTLTTSMKSVGEAMALGRNYIAGLNKVLRSLENKESGFWTYPDEHFAGESAKDKAAVVDMLRVPKEGRLYLVELALRLGASVDEIHEASGIDPWFIAEIEQLVAFRKELEAAPVLTEELLRRAKYLGLSDVQIASVRPELAGENGVRTLRWSLGIRPVFKTVDTCAAEFEAKTPYHYSAYELDPAAESEVTPQREKEKILILGSGPNRIGQGIEFDYSCVHAALELSRIGYETVMVNCNPETVSTDYDTADRLYFEPLTFEDVMEVYHAESESGNVAGVICQLGGQTPLGLAERLKEAGVPVIGTTPEAINLAEDRGEFGGVLERSELPAPAYGTAKNLEEAQAVASSIGYPVLVRPSYVLGGRGMEIVYDDDSLADYISRATEITHDHPVLVDRFLDNAIEIDVDALCDGDEVYLAGVMEHIEEAGIHSGDSACAIPPMTLGTEDIDTVRRSTASLAREIGVRGLMNVQFALKDDTLYVIEANPRASRTVPFVSKATGVPLAKAAARISVGATLQELRMEGMIPTDHDGGSLPLDAPIAVKEAVLPFRRFRRQDGSLLDSLLSPEMKSTGEVMGLDRAFGAAYAKSQSGAYGRLPVSGTVFVSVANHDKRTMVFPIQRLATLGFSLLATEGTAGMLRRNGIPCEVVAKQSQVHEDNPSVDHVEVGTVHRDKDGRRSIVDLILDEQVDLIINTPAGSSGARHDGYEIRAAALNAEIPCITTVQAAVAAVQAIESIHGISETASKGEESAGQGHPQPGQDGAEEDDRRPNASLMVAAIQDLHA
ncbi:carbamoyl-phosphate synthase large subunit [Corynebacterium sp. MC-04]|uniref:Carbamoyl phosphate synthase large chain n=1 Tax=Corynebacterium parakroppenstedtii TaxID=2828363 RepID=A0ABS9HKC8_9CORY|nr:MULTISPECIES: carbamoyl-phosphate synthase large subunit [Corynebacterium]KXB51500.1 carbamoyl-phosphate synthase, large subunit [Corynebacterium kroppenstedtii]MBY0791802.1 carbamoyl-phosphate synthase large subunit [Corynebacterium parakroppenstedtii]MCF6768753.1 carbamoyl-phosphate synthase large subunit [Corynebacterium parakroppenstedtii]MCF6771387.1 carbamoyl-phosphate synthase large subunit [Corynebacterium parakroppenstedtii]MCF6773480.1 carbamoyl-phosphate synthase large subunit [C